jgi:regulator of protease activity HflC (stomatin/prohibitin superfamily)
MSQTARSLPSHVTDPQAQGYTALDDEPSITLQATQTSHPLLVTELSVDHVISEREGAGIKPLDLLT